jgi:uncharacterized protein
MPILMCPNCNEGMQEVRRNEVQIDVWPNAEACGLDPGELEELLHSAEADYDRERESWMRQTPSYGGHGDYDHRPYKRKKSFLEQIFD